MDINRDIQCHFKKYVKYITPNCIVFYDCVEYNNYMKEYIIDDKKIYPKVNDISIHSKK
jgi:hypothetical protein